MHFTSEPAGILDCPRSSISRSGPLRTISKGALLAAIALAAARSAPAAWPQAATAGPPSPLPSASPEESALSALQGLPVRGISFEGVPAERLAPLPGHLAQAIDAPLTLDAVRASLRQLFATGLFDTLEAAASRQRDGVALVFRGTPRAFIGTVRVEGAKGASVNAELERASQLFPGTRFTDARLTQALVKMRDALAANGFHDPDVQSKLTPHPEEQLVDIEFHVASGPQARVGDVQVTGDAGMTQDEFRRRAHLSYGSRVDHDTASRALAGILKYYQNRERLEAEIKLASERYAADTRRANFQFSANRGPVVKVSVEGAAMDPERLKRVIPIFEEGAVDEDLLNEGNRRLRDYYQRLGYFDVKVEHRRETPGPGQVVIFYKVDLGQRGRLDKVSVAGNRYFDSETLAQLLSVHPADPIDRHGSYSQALISADVNSLEGLYRNNGFSRVRVTPETLKESTGKPNKTAPIAVVYHVEEGEQVRVGAVRLEGNDHADAARLTSMLNTSPGQLLSPQNLANDRDTLLTDYLSRGFDQARVDLSQQPDPSDAGKVDVLFRIREGQQVFVRKVLVTGLRTTRPSTVDGVITLHPGDPLNQTAVTETQRNLYDLALFNEVNLAVENPNGGEAFKTILLQATEARRWTLTYGLGFEAQTGTPQNNCQGVIATGIPCNPNGKTGVSPRVLADLTRNSILGRDQSASLRGTYGLLEQKIDLLFQVPHFEGNRNWGLTFSGGYANSQDVTTYVASRLQAGARFTQRFLNPGSLISKANTFVYEYDFRRVKVSEDSLQVGPSELTQLSSAVRVAGPAITWIRDTRDSPLDAHRGTYTSFQEFLSARPFGAEAQFNRLDLSNSSYYTFDRGRFVLARNARYAQERAFGSPANELIPLPERLYAGGATSLRGFPINAAGPRDPETGYPIGGAGALILSTELRLPPPTLPWLGNTLSFVLFHDMGNIFTNAGDAWVSLIRIHQPDRDACKVLTFNNPSPVPSGPETSTGRQGQCSFNYASHTPGLGLRYHTPVGPIRLDFSYNLNPPIYPVNLDYTNPTWSPHVGEAKGFNFFFSLGQTF